MKKYTYTTRRRHTEERNQKLCIDFTELDKLPLSKLVKKVPAEFEGETKTDYVMKILTDKYFISEKTILRILTQE